MKFLLIISLLFLVGCGEMNQVQGAPEILVQDPMNAAVTVQTDGSRLVTINQGEVVRVIILLPPLKTIELEKK